MVEVLTKKILWVTFSFFVLLYFCSVPSHAQYGGGTGEPNDPYQIATAEDLMLLGETPEDYDKHFILIVDIDLDPNLPGRKVFDRAVIAPDMNEGKGGHQGNFFTGVFNGNEHTISNLTIKGKQYLGLFGKLTSQAEVKDLGVVDVNIAGSYVGGLAGINQEGLVIRCYSTGQINGGSTAGGLVSINYGAITQCFSTVVVNGRGWRIGGLVGRNWDSLINCYSTGSVSGNIFVGGLIGDNSGVVTHCYSIGAVSGNDHVGGLVGSGRYFVTGCFWDIQSSGQTSSEGGTGLITDKMQDIQTYLDVGWDFAGEFHDGLHETWLMPQEAGYPTLAVHNGYTPPQLQGLGTLEEPYLISNAEELGALIHYSPYAHYRLDTSIDLSGIRWGMAVIPWFRGTFEGNNQTISNLKIKGVSNLGLFGQLKSWCKIKNLGVVEVDVTGSGSRVGGLTGYNDGYVIRCSSSGVVSSTGAAGGLVGYNECVLIHCYSTCAVNVIGESVGGLVGHNLGNVTYCYGTGAISGSNYVGGLLGYNSSIVNQCYSTGVVNGIYRVGGLVGYSTSSRVAHCYSTGMVRGIDYVGGLAGGGGNVIHCYSTGSVSGNNYVGGLMGRSWGDVTHCFWDTDNSGLSNMCGIIDDDSTGCDDSFGKTTNQMQTAKTFLDADWDFVDETQNGKQDVWWILEGQDYPKLVWKASFPDPYHCAPDVIQPAILSWQGTIWAVGHDVYFGEDEDIIANATPDSFGIYCGQQPAVTTSYNPGDLEYGKTYYWRIDEVNETDPHNNWKGNIWKFTTADFVTLLHPPDGATDVSLLTNLAWVPGGSRLQYDIYFGLDEDKVSNATIENLDIYRGRQPSGMTTYEPGSLEWGRTYYWRIDGIDNTEPNRPLEGNVWSFTTLADFIVIDDFEDYNAFDNLIWESWKDGLGYGVPVYPPNFYVGNGTGAVVGDTNTPSSTEEAIVHGGQQSMPYEYDNNKQGFTNYSEATLTLSYPRDWTEGGVTTLTLWFYGDPANAPEPIYVAIANTNRPAAVVYYDNPDEALKDNWTEWNIELQDFADQGVNLTDVNSIAIGFGDRNNPQPGGRGKMYFDDIRLYPPLSTESNDLEVNVP